MSDPHYHKVRHKEWRTKVIRQAKGKCQDCAEYGMSVEATVAHHIKSREDHPELQYVVSNGRALCQAHHNKRHPEKGGRGKGYAD